MTIFDILCRQVWDKPWNRQLVVTMNISHSNTLFNCASQLFFLVSEHKSSLFQSVMIHFTPVWPARSSPFSLSQLPVSSPTVCLLTVTLSFLNFTSFYVSSTWLWPMGSVCLCACVCVCSLSRKGSLSVVSDLLSSSHSSRSTSLYSMSNM